jgi:uncharacterized protein YggE
MEWAQVLAIVVPVMLTIVIGVIYNNKRIDDLRADMDRRFAEVHDELKEIKADIREIRQFFLRLIPTPEPPKENPR